MYVSAWSFFTGAEAHLYVKIFYVFSIADAVRMLTHGDSVAAAGNAAAEA